MNVIITVKKCFECTKEYSSQGNLKDKIAMWIKISHVRK